MGVVLHHPVNHVAGQSVLAGEREDAAVFDAAQSAVGRGPERAAPIRVEAADGSLSQPFGASVRGAELTVLEISNATVSKTKP
jgi:hypothetical protein